LTAHFPPEQILTPNTGTEKLYQTYYYRRKVLVRIRASGPPPAEGGTVFHEVLMSFCRMPWTTTIHMAYEACEAAWKKLNK
jgi:hypothetical protein